MKIFIFRIYINNIYFMIKNCNFVDHQPQISKNQITIKISILPSRNCAYIFPYGHYIFLFDYQTSPTLGSRNSEIHTHTISCLSTKPNQLKSLPLIHSALSISFSTPISNLRFACRSSADPIRSAADSPVGSPLLR